LILDFKKTDFFPSSTIFVGSFKKMFFEPIKIFEKLTSLKRLLVGCGVCKTFLKNNFLNCLYQCLKKKIL
jgi:hypothetical protein